MGALPTHSQEHSCLFLEDFVNLNRTQLLIVLFSQSNIVSLSNASKFRKIWEKQTENVLNNDWSIWTQDKHELASFRCDQFKMDESGIKEFLNQQLKFDWLVGWLYWCLTPLQQLRSYHGDR